MQPGCKFTMLTSLYIGLQLQQILKLRIKLGNALNINAFIFGESLYYMTSIVAQLKFKCSAKLSTLILNYTIIVLHIMCIVYYSIVLFREFRKRAHYCRCGIFLKVQFRKMVNFGRACAWQLYEKVVKRRTDAWRDQNRTNWR